MGVVAVGVVALVLGMVLLVVLGLLEVVAVVMAVDAAVVCAVAVLGEGCCLLMDWWWAIAPRARASV